MAESWRRVARRIGGRWSVALTRTECITQVHLTAAAAARLAPVVQLLDASVSDKHVRSAVASRYPSMPAPIVSAPTAAHRRWRDVGQPCSRCVVHGLLGRRCTPRDWWGGWGGKGVGRGVRSSAAGVCGAQWCVRPGVHVCSRSCSSLRRRQEQAQSQTLPSCHGPPRFGGAGRLQRSPSVARLP